MAEVIKTWTKDPDSGLIYGLDWSEWLDTGEEIMTSEWTVAGDDDALVASDDEKNATSTSVKLSAGTVGVTYTVTNSITTAEQNDDRSIGIIVKER